VDGTELRDKVQFQMNGDSVLLTIKSLLEQNLQLTCQEMTEFPNLLSHFGNERHLDLLFPEKLATK
jgi:hypothetical protein